MTTAYWVPFLAGVAWRSAVLLAAAQLAAWCLRRSSAAARHAVWSAAALALGLLPLLQAGLPRLMVPAPGWAQPAAVFQVEAVEQAEPLPALDVAEPAAPRLSAPGFNYGAALAWIWLAGAAFGAAKVVWAYGALWRLRRGAVRLERAELRAACAAVGATESTPVLVSDACASPLTFGVVRPVVMLPAEALGWPEARLRMALLHEFSHVARRDALLHVLARLAFSLYWWNPLAWFGWRRFLQERERAADDAAISAGVQAPDYADELLTLARQARAGFGWNAAAAMARPSQLEGRLLAILNPGTNRRAPGRAALAATAFGALALLAPLAAIQAKAQRGAAVMQAAFAPAVAAQQSSQAAPPAVPPANLAAGENTPLGLTRLGDWAMRREDRIGALNYYRGAASFGDRPETARALMMLGLMELTGQRALSEGYLERARVSDPTGDTGRQAEAWLRVIRSPNPLQEVQTGGAEYLAVDGQRRSLIPAASPERAAGIAWFTQLQGSQVRRPTPEVSPIETPGLAARVAALSPQVDFRGEVVQLGPGVTAPSVTRKVEPEYSAEARRARFEGTVVLRMVVDTDGMAKNIRVAHSLGLGLDEAAVRCLSAWLFRPGMRNGVPVPVEASVEVNFHLLARPAGQAAQDAASANAVYVPAETAQTTVVGLVYRPGAGVTAPALVRKVEPEYSAEARAARLQGTVVLRVQVDTDGTPKNISVMKSLGMGLDEQAVRAVSGWRFVPGTRQGMPVAVESTIEVNFRLLDNPGAGPDAVVNSNGPKQ